VAKHRLRAWRTTVYGSSQVHRLRRLARRPVPSATYLMVAAGAAAAVVLAGLHLPWLALTVLVLLLVPAGLVLTALWTRTAITLGGRDAMRAWVPVQQAYLQAERFVPAVRDILPGEEPAEVLRHARMEIARLVADRSRLRRSRRDAVSGCYGLPLDDPLRVRLTERIREIDSRIAEIGIEVTRRTEALTSLAKVWAEFVYQRDRATRQARASRRAERALSRTDNALGTTATAADRPDEATDLVERSNAVLAAYRELMTQPS
jgi:hypothetical protein